MTTFTTHQKSQDSGTFHRETSARLYATAGSHALLSVNELQVEVNEPIEEEVRLCEVLVEVDLKVPPEENGHLREESVIEIELQQDTVR